MTEFIRLLIFIKIVIKNAIRSGIIYEGVRGVFILLFIFMKKFHTQKKKHKMQTGEIKHLLFRHLKKNLEKKAAYFFVS